MDNQEDPVKGSISEEDLSWFTQLVIYAARNPWDFCWYLLLALSPLFCISAVLSWRLAKAIEAQEKNEKEKKRKDKKNANMLKVLRGKNN